MNYELRVSIDKSLPNMIGLVNHWYRTHSVEIDLQPFFAEHPVLKQVGCKRFESANYDALFSSTDRIDGEKFSHLYENNIVVRDFCIRCHERSSTLLAGSGFDLRHSLTTRASPQALSKITFLLRLRRSIYVFDSIFLRLISPHSEKWVFEYIEVAMTLETEPLISLVSRLTTASRPPTRLVENEKVSMHQGVEQREAQVVVRGSECVRVDQYSSQGKSH